MYAARNATLTIFLVMSAVGTSAAAVPEGDIDVGFWDGPPVVRYPGQMGIRFHLDPDGSVRSARLRSDEVFVGGARDSRIAEAITNDSRLAPQTYILVGVSQPEKTNFSTTLKSIQRLRRLAAENAVDGSKLEILVFPDARPKHATGAKESPK